MAVMVDFFNIASGSLVKATDIISGIKPPSIIIFGELHENMDIVNAELSILKAAYNLSTKINTRLVLGMEHFNVQQQILLDKFLEDKIPWETLVDEYSRGPEGFNLEYYKPVLFFAKRHKIQVIGLMPPRNIAKIVVREGLRQDLLERYGLQRSDIESYPKGYFDRFAKLIPQNGPMRVFSIKQLVIAQSFKDEVMATNIAKEIRKGAGLVYAIMGSGHCEHIGTVPDRIERYLATLHSKIVITSRIKTDEKSLVKLLEELKGDNLIIAKYVYIT
jgi:uncharacterized iron-regulated protein